MYFLSDFNIDMMLDGIKILFSVFKVLDLY